MHYGVEGQKWGIRRYQNADGSLTAEGRIHYGVGNLDYNARYSGDKKSAVKAFKKERKDLYKKLNDTDYSDTEKIGQDAGYKYEQDYNKKHKEIRNKLLKGVGIDIDDPENIDLYYDAEALEYVVNEHNKMSKDKLKLEDVDRYFNSESNPDDWDWDWEKEQMEISNKNYQAAKSYVDDYLTSKYGKNILDKNRISQRERSLIATGALVTTGVIAGGLLLANKIDKDAHGGKDFVDRINERRKKSAESNVVTDDTINKALKNEATSRGMSDDEFDRVIKNQRR